jgi:hypothetical protein
VRVGEHGGEGTTGDVLLESVEQVRRHAPHPPIVTCAILVDVR